MRPSMQVTQTPDLTAKRIEVSAKAWGMASEVLDTVEDVTNSDTPNEPDASADDVEPISADGPDEQTGGQAGDDAGDGLTLKEVLLGEAGNVELPPEVTKAAVTGARTALEFLNEQQSKALLKAWRPLERSSALHTAELAQKVLGNFDTSGLVAPMLEQFSTTIDPLNDRIHAQLAATLPASQIAMKFAPLQDIAKNFVPKGVLGNLSNIVVPDSVFKNLYGSEFSGIASKLVNFQKLFENIDWESITVGWYPPNWDEDRGIEQYATFIQLAADEGLPMTWVPNAELTYLLAEAGTVEARGQLLVEHSSTIVTDCRTVLADFDDRTDLVTQLETALDAYAAGFHGPAQSYAASIIDTALRQVFTIPKRWSYPSVKKVLHTGDDWQSTELRSARVLPTSVALLNLLKDFWTDGGDPIPTMPNRHAAAHAVHPDQFNQVNAIKFLMLATAMLAEIEHDGWARILADAA